LKAIILMLLIAIVCIFINFLFVSIAMVPSETRKKSSDCFKNLLAIN
jgi:hypothetical protein